MLPAEEGAMGAREPQSRGRSREEWIEIAHRHAAAEAEDDLAGTLATLDPDPVYEFEPVGLVLRGMPAVRTYYEHFFATFEPRIAGFTLRSEWVTDEGLGQEYWIDLRLPDGGTQREAVVGILLFGEQGLRGERIYASDSMLRTMLGPAHGLARPRTAAMR
jgi:hypothetical protein